MGILEDFLRSVDSVAIFGVDRNQDVTLGDAILITLCFQFGNSHPDESTSDPADRATCGSATKRCEQGSRSNKGTDAGNCEGANTSQKSESTAEHTACGDASDCGFRSLGVLLVGELVSGMLVREQNRDVVR